MFAAIERL